jgi:hypothetical protein
MPTLKQQETVDVEIYFEVYCGICGSGCCGDTHVNDRRNIITVTCSDCSNKIKDLENKIESLEKELDEEKSKQ